MSILNSSMVGAGGYDIGHSLRFRSSASAYLNRTPASAGNCKTWTWSSWIKRGDIGTQTRFMSCNGTASDRLVLLSDNTIEMTIAGARLTTTQVFRDPSAWYHFVVVWDTTQGTSSNRFKLYVNGSQVTAFSTANYPAQNATSSFGATNTWVIGAGSTGALEPFDGYFAEMHYVNGQALTPSSFGETDTTTGVWKPKAYSGTYGTNGFYLKFSDIATTSGSNAGLGKDFSGNTNYWTTNNISVTAGTTYDAMTDSPTNTSATVANYATFAGTNLGTYANATITEAGLKVSVSAGGTPDGGKAYAPFGMSDGSGKWYFEMTCVDPGSSNQRLCFGIANVTTNPNAIAITNGYYASASGAHGNYNIGTFTTNDVLQVAYDSGTNKLWFGKNGTWYNSGNPAAGTTPLVTVTSGITYVPFSTYASSGGGPGIGAWNFGQRPFSYTPPTGFKALNTFNLPDPTIKKPNQYMDATTYSGNGTSQTITNAAGFAPDLVWIKGRNYADNHTLWNTVVGAQKSLSSDTTTAETTRSTALTAFTSTGFTLGSDTITNYSAGTYVGWQWKESATAGFDIVTYTGDGTASRNINHSLGVAPKLYILKARNAVGSWPVCYTFGSGSLSYMYLNATNAAGTASQSAPTSTTFNVQNAAGDNTSATTYVAYLFAEIPGYSKFGSYTGNGSADGPFVFANFQPKYVLIKCTSTTGNWVVWDTTRNTYNVLGAELYPNLSNAESSAIDLDITSNGFKIRNTTAAFNSSGATYIYAAFASYPFKYSTGF